MRAHIIGARGRLGQALAAEYGKDDVYVEGGAIYRKWARPGAADEVARHFERCDPKRTILFVASGLLDPSLSPKLLHGVNYHLPQNVVDGAARLGIKIVTFGTAMEQLTRSPNPYVASKIALANHIRNAAAAGAPVTHIQIHTLYGVGEPSPFMFLGQILSSIRSNMPFRMTSGRQLREYHHFSDEARAIRVLAEGSCTGVVTLSHGAPVQLIEIAESVFAAFGKRDLLMAGALPEPAEENYEKALIPPLNCRPLAFRDTLPAVVQYMKECVSRPAPEVREFHP